MGDQTHATLNTSGTSTCPCVNESTWTSWLKRSWIKLHHKSKNILKFCDIWENDPKISEMVPILRKPFLSIARITVRKMLTRSYVKRQAYMYSMSYLLLMQPCGKRLRISTFCVSDWRMSNKPRVAWRMAACCWLLPPRWWCRGISSSRSWWIFAKPDAQLV